MAHCFGRVINVTKEIYFKKAPNNEVIRTLIAAGAKVNKQDNFGATPLMFATLRGNYDAVNELLKAKGTAVNVRTWANTFRIPIGGSKGALTVRPLT